MASGYKASDGPKGKNSSRIKMVDKPHEFQAASIRGVKCDTCGKNGMTQHHIALEKEYEKTHGAFVYHTPDKKEFYTSSHGILPKNAPLNKEGRYQP